MNLIKNINQIKLGVIGMGYVGLPLAYHFSKKRKVICFDINKNRISELKKGLDTNNEFSSSDLKKKNLIFTNKEIDLSSCNFFLVTVPTPIYKNRKPNLKYLLNASRTVAKFIKKGSFVVYESTVYPGCTQEVCIPIIEKITKLKVNNDFFCGYSPERINPGDKKNNFENIVKVLSGSNSYSTSIIDQLYSSVVRSGTFIAANIKTAEAAKIIENTQRDINISLMNEFSIICNKLNLKTKDVIETANTKWNFLNFKPGLVGGHCIGVDPYYLSHKALEIGCNPKVILSGREVNDSMPKIIVKDLIYHLKKKNIIKFNNLRLLVIGLSFKENCSDIRNSKSIEMIKLLKRKNFKVHSYDPISYISDKIIIKSLNIKKTLKKNYYDVIILSVPHQDIIKKGFKKMKCLGKKNAIFFDLKSAFPKLKSDYSL
jgi:UDP-N-acetyl-D-galactosamine dehydrogenase